MKFLIKLFEVVVLIFSCVSILVLSVLLYVKRLWPDADYEQIRMTMRDISLDLIIRNTVVMDYVWGFLFFAIVFPLCYFYLNTKKQLVLSVLVSIVVAWYSGFIDYCIYANTKSSLYEDEYVSFKNLEYKFPQKKRNLLLIYMESFESNFSNEKYYGKNLIPNLEKLQKEGEYSLEFRNMPGATYSIAALVASNCGIPLRFSQNRDLWSAKFFLPRANCWPEILKENGYQTEIIKAADITFTNVNLFAKQHGFQEALGVDEIRKEIGEENFKDKIGTFSGVRDRVLFDFAKKKIEAFDEDKPFMLTLFSLDTHTPNPFIEKECAKPFGDVRDAFLCAEKHVVDFVEWFKTTKYWENTTVVIVGDHLFPSKMKGQEKASKRSIYNVFLNVAKGLKIKKDKIFSTFDLGPSILESLGIELKPRAFGLGRSMFSDEKSLMEKLGASQFKIRLMQKSDVYDEFFKPNVERVEEFKQYKLGDILEGKDIISYTDSYLETLGRFYVDRLNFELLDYKGGDVEVELKFFAIVSFRSGVKILANDVLLKEAKYGVGDKQPYTYKLKISKEVIKDGKIQFKFRNLIGGNMKEHRLGISINSLEIREL